MTHNLRLRLLAPYHYLLAVGSTVLSNFPGKKLTIIGVTGTKGKSSVTEMLYAIFTEAGRETAAAGTIRFVIGKESEVNLFKMTLPGRGFIQRFLNKAVKKGCTHAIIEITSEAARQNRHLGLYLDGLVFTNLQKEHLESHGGMENYFLAKFAIGEALVRSPKRPRVLVANADDEYGLRFLELPVEKRIPFQESDARELTLQEHGVSFLYKQTLFKLPQPGKFSAMNALAAIKTAEAFGIHLETCATALAKLSHIAGRTERIAEGQDFTVVVDYAHTPDSLTALYGAFPERRKICILGNTGGGRDTWKRPEMGKIADDACAEVILTNEDPYDEDPRAIVDAMATGMKRAPTIIMDRREAIRYALKQAHENDVVLISGKGTDPYIMGPRGEKTPWSDAGVVREELLKIVANTA